MVDNQHKQIQGYRDLQQDEIDLMNEIKQIETQVAHLWKDVVEVNELDDVAATVDMRWANTAKIHFQEGFSALVRSVAKPKDPFASSELPSREDNPGPDESITRDNPPQADPADELNSLTDK